MHLKDTCRKINVHVQKPSPSTGEKENNPAQQKHAERHSWTRTVFIQVIAWGPLPSFFRLPVFTRLGGPNIIVCKMEKRNATSVLRNSERRATSLGDGRKPGVAAAKTSLATSYIAWIVLGVEAADGFLCRRRLLFDDDEDVSATVLPPSGIAAAAWRQPQKKNV